MSRIGKKVIAVPKVTTGPVSNRKEFDMARQLVEALAGSFHPEEYRDRFREQVEELAEKKAHGEAIRFPRAPARKKPRDLESSLAASLKAVRRAS